MFKNEHNQFFNSEMNKFVKADVSKKSLLITSAALSLLHESQKTITHAKTRPHFCNVDSLPLVAWQLDGCAWAFLF